jgi:hypothetical protein
MLIVVVAEIAPDFSPNNITDPSTEPLTPETQISSGN